MVYKILNGLAPERLKMYFTPVSDVSARNTRETDENLLYLPKCRLELTKKSFSYRAIKLWNNLPLYIRQAPTLDCFKKALSDFLTPGAI